MSKATNISQQSLIDVTFGNGKYRLTQNPHGWLRCLRYGEEWRDLTGDKMILALAHEVLDLREAFRELAQIDGSTKNFADAEALDARVRSFAREKLVTERE